eukprot:Phypoly_transcript_08049.p1 GENE.Phypoly_transcript_08049~~Phypoly_transcript_08049.p1  ORF type:complete len:477 (+),score=67.42 Phypoly_transcript_08049:163-1431(+)
MKAYIYDFDIIPSLQGVYIANQIGNDQNSHSVISFDNGGAWTTITPPAIINGVSSNCSLANNCSLHLHGITSWYTGVSPPLYSVPTAVGLLIAVGNAGTSLSFNQSELSTFITRDGGLTWTQLWDKSTVYDVGDHGGLVVFAEFGINTSTIYYTTNEGATVQSYNLSSPLIINNIITDSSGVSRKFVVLATDPVLGGVMFGLDFSDELNVTCTDADYVNWTPTDGEHGNAACFMGATTTYIRRNYTTQCFTNLTDHVITQTACPCAFEDYECEYDFFPSPRNSTDGFTCTPANSSTTPSCDTGYTLVPGTMCTLNAAGALNLLTVNCSTTSSTTGSSTISTTTSSHSSSISTGLPSITTTTTTGHHKKGHAGEAVGLTFLFMFLGVVVIAGLLYWKNPRFRIWVMSKLGQDTGVYQRIAGNS